ncbi:DUF4126 domain-containing protein [Thermoleptolyngbya sp. C42_A2020_037]|uniref:DUF4126 domain-containing protein n=1 Tax=Thermoleptolyngbya sp. C42_A2020_037 TaxID=2747799 RepID=UPI0019E6D7DF|nr:DUF4126 domain-containing protein [Thermoleptolyngbya sp. C42_A2020_037]MBF2086142.1 DUF4126 domain-containing protein [Thermoleptolyngbya sp. C42_A2020_037]
MVEVLAILSISAATGMRIALPLLLIGLLQRESLWSSVPLLSQVPPPLVLGVLVSWSLVELLFSKDRLAQRLLQIVELACSPVVGAIAGITVARLMQTSQELVPVAALVSGLLALVFQLVQVGWFYRLRGLPLWAIFLQDFLCVLLVLFAFDAPRQGGLIALLLLWLAIRSTAEWQQWYQAQASAGDRRFPRRGKQDPD